LYVVYLGGDPAPGRLSEDHETVVVVAQDDAGARRAARAKWAGPSKAHVDALQCVGVVDGYRVRLEATDEPPSTEVDGTYVLADD
jgi:hypothetical protein